MERIPVDSSNIASIGYDEETYTLEIEFHNGGVYQYFDVPVQIYFEFMDAESKGKFLSENIKGNYRYVRI